MDLGKVLGLAALALLTGVASAKTTTVPFINQNNLGSLVSLQVREDGRYDVICKDNKKEIATSVQLMLGSICPAGAIKTAAFLSIQVSQNGMYSVICKDKDSSHHIVTSDDIANGRVCMVETTSNGDSIGSVNGHDYYKVQVTGVMSDVNALAACKAAGLEAACNDVQNGQFSDDKCIDVGLKDGGNPMRTLSQAICAGQDPGRCDKLNNTFQYMGGKWSGYTCGALNGTWCMNGGSVSNALALCVSPLSN